VPAPVDHEARRQHVAQVAAELVVARGVEALTVRNLADALGFSTAVVSHYFTDKQDLLLVTYRVAGGRRGAGGEAAEARGGQRLKRCLEALLPLDDERRSDWYLFYAFWGTAMSRPELAAEQRAHVQSARGRIERVLAGECAAGVRTARYDKAATARRLLVLVHGVAAQAMFDPEDWPASRQRRFLSAELKVLLRAPAAQPESSGR
jgi:AcrR family transcriptional regulator